MCEAVGLLVLCELAVICVQSVILGRDRASICVWADGLSAPVVTPSLSVAVS